MTNASLKLDLNTIINDLLYLHNEHMSSIAKKKLRAIINKINTLELTLHYDDVIDTKDQELLMLLKNYYHHLDIILNKLRAFRVCLGSDILLYPKDLDDIIALVENDRDEPEGLQGDIPLHKSQ